MARVTVEDCVEVIPNRFDLVLLASQRARQISAGSALTIQRDYDKNPVVALREIASQTVPLDDLQEAMIQALQKHLHSEDFDQDLEEFSSEETVYPDTPEQLEEIEKLAVLEEETETLFEDDSPEED